MILNITRIALWLVISISATLKIRASKIAKKRFITMLIVLLCMVLLSISAMFPIENFCIDFKNPENVFNYASFGEVDEIVYGKDSCMVIYSRGNSKGGHYIIPKTEKGYSIPSYFTTKKISHKFDENGIFEVYSVNGTQDYYIFGTAFLENKDSKIMVIDENNEKVDSDIIKVGDTNFIYFYLNDNPKAYYLLVNGERISITK